MIKNFPKPAPSRSLSRPETANQFKELNIYEMQDAFQELYSAMIGGVPDAEKDYKDT